MENDMLCPRKLEGQFNSQSPKRALMSLSWPEGTFGWLFPGCHLYIKEKCLQLGPLTPCTVRGLRPGSWGDTGPRCARSLHGAWLLWLLISSFSVCVPRDGIWVFDHCLEWSTQAQRKKAKSLLCIQVLEGKLISASLYYQEGSPGGSVVKNLPASARDTGSIPGSERSPGGENGNSLQYSCLDNPKVLRSLAGCSPQGCRRVRHD